LNDKYISKDKNTLPHVSSVLCNNLPLSLSLSISLSLSYLPQPFSFTGNSTTSLLRSTTMSSGELLQIHPQELQFPCKHLPFQKKKKPKKVHFSMKNSVFWLLCLVLASGYYSNFLFFDFCEHSWIEEADLMLFAVV